FEVGGYYSMKGVKFKGSDTKVTLNYAGVFGNALLFFPLINNNDIYVGGGIYALQALNGKTKKSDTARSPITFGNTWKKFDGGLQLRAGFNIKNVIAFGLHYDLGAFKNYSSIDLRGEDFDGRTSVITLFISIKLAKL
ncbi:MAG TPA: hypothetical protein VN958_14690, partial [Chitinophagaceae bacterium]|nr:hypothetical protein [Chitinophagaceae bacterium]